MPRRIVGGATAAKASVGGRAEPLGLEDRPLALVPSRDGKRVIVALPHALCVVAAQGLELERTIELRTPIPSVTELDEGGVLVIGGAQLLRGSLFSTVTIKIGTKLGGVVDRVCLLRSSLLCGVGGQGEVLWDLDKEDAVHRRKVSERETFGLVASADGRAVWLDGSTSAWVIDPEHTSGYMRLRLRPSEPEDCEDHELVAVGITTGGRCVLAARDGAVGWTDRALRPVGEVYPDGRTAPICVFGDRRHVYALHRGGRLQRFLVEPPPEDSDEPPPPPAEECRLERIASTAALGGDGTLYLAGPHADDQLGRLWSVETDTLPWSPLRLHAVRAPGRARPPVEDGRPSFVAIRTKVQGPPLSELKVDGVLAGETTLWVTKDHGPITERPVAPLSADAVMPADTVLLPAMVRANEGTARPALVVWPGSAHEDHEPAAPHFVVWGDRPRGWIPLQTPAIREQGWSRREVFPLQVALHAPVPDLAGHRRPLPKRWVDPESFAALGRECKKLLRVLW